MQNNQGNLMWTKKLKIDGMTCPNCVEEIEKNLNAYEGVEIQVSYSESIANLTVKSNLSLKYLIKKIKDQGYKVFEFNRQTGQQLHVAIIGSGSAAFACALRAVEHGAKVTIVECKPIIGGTCVNSGCIPSKIMIRASQIIHWQKNHPFSGIKNQKPVINRKEMLIQQQERVGELRAAKYESILETNPNISLVKGTARFKNTQTLIIDQERGAFTEIKADRFLIATGASSNIPQISGLAKTPYWTSTEALLSEKVPDHLIVIGSSIVALELAQAYLRLGSKVTLLARHTLLLSQDPDIGLELHNILEAEGMVIQTQTQAETVNYKKGLFSSGKFMIETNQGQSIEADHLLIAAGRSPNTQGLALNQVGIDTSQNGAIIIDDHMRTNVEHIYAAGDCSTQPQYVYVAAAAGNRAAINMTGGSASIDLSVMPVVMFTEPQMATVGMTVAEASQHKIRTDSRRLSLQDVPRSLVNFETRGFIKLVIEEQTRCLIGAQILAPEAGEMIQTAALAIFHRMTIEELAGQLFPYLTMVEGIKLCAQTFSKDIKALSCCAG